MNAVPLSALRIPFAPLALLALSLCHGALRLPAQSYDFSTLAGAYNARGFADGTGGEARFYYPSGIAVDPAGTLYLADTDNRALRRISPTGLVSTIPVQPAGHFLAPVRIILDAAGNLYVSDAKNHTISRVSPGGMATVIAGQPGSVGATDGIGSSARFAGPAGLAFDPQGNLYVADSGNAAIRRITPGGAVTTFAGTLGTTGSRDGPAASALFAHPLQLAFDRTGNLYVADAPATVRKISPDGIVSTLAGAAGQTGTQDGRGAEARFMWVGGLAVAPSGTLVVVDALADTIRSITADGTVTTIAGQTEQRRFAEGVGGAARFSNPQAIAVGAAGELYLIDGFSAMIRKGSPTAAAGPPIIHTPPASAQQLNRALGARASLALAVGATGSPPLTYRWTRNGAPIADATTASYSVPSVSVLDEGSYAVTVSNAAGSVTSTPVMVRVYSPSLSAFTSRRAIAGGRFLWGIASNGQQLVAVGTEGTILTSGDGQGWTRRASGTSQWLVAVTHGDGKFVAVGDGGTILVSTDGAAWRPATASATNQRLNNVAYGGGRFVAVGEGGAIVTSVDGLLWTAAISGVNTWLRGLTYVPPDPLPPFHFGDNGTGSFYASGENGVLLRGGTTWTSQDNLPMTGGAATRKDLEALTAGAVGIGQDGVLIHKNLMHLWSKSPIARMPDGSYRVAVSVLYRWSSVTMGINARFRGLASAAGALFAMGENGVVAAASDVAGPWSIIPTHTTANLVNGVFHGNSLFVVGENETILQSDPLYAGRLINIATRGYVGAGSAAMISGFVVSGSAPKPVLLRGAGPALASFGVNGTLAAPVLTLFDSTGRQIATNTRWGTAANAAEINDLAARVGAFPFAGDSADSALVVTLPPGAYTAALAGRDGATGIGLVEAYDAEPLSREGSRAINVSTRGHVGTDGGRLIAGFVIDGAASRRVLIRAAGPSLASLGVEGALREPELELFDHRGSRHYRVGAWSAQPNADAIRSAAEQAGAFPFADDSKDAALIASLLPGSWTVQISGLNNTTGIAIAEVYELP